MKNVNCNFCGHESDQILYSLRDWQTEHNETFTLVRCHNCGLLYLNPQPSWEELIPYYPDHYRPYVLPDKKGRNSFFAKIKSSGWRRRKKVIEGKIPGGRILDVGCATGEFLAVMETSDRWECHGVEPVSYAASIARQNTHARILEGTLLDANYPDDFFDVITLWDVLEHTADPVSIFRETHRILKPGGVLIMCVPDPDSVTGRWFGASWVGYDAPRHLHTFPKATLAKQLAFEEFEKIEIAYLSSDHYLFFGSLAVFCYTHHLPFGGIIFAKISKSTWMRIFLAIFFLFERWLGFGSAPVYFACSPAKRVDKK